MGSSIESVTQIGCNPQGFNRTTESFKVRFQCEVMGAQQSIIRKRRTTNRTSRTSLTSRTSSTSRGGKDNFVDVASFDFRREEMDAEMEYRKDYFQSRKVGCITEHKKASSSKRLTNSWKGKGGHTV